MEFDSNAFFCDRCLAPEVFGYRTYNFQEDPRAVCKRCWYVIEEGRQFDADQVFTTFEKKTGKSAQLSLPLCPYCDGDSLEIIDAARHPSGVWGFTNGMAHIWARCCQCDIAEPILLTPPPPVFERDMFRGS